MKLWKKSIIFGGLIAPFAIGGLWTALHTFPWMGPLVANTLRATIGKENVTRLEDFAYAIEDRLNQQFKSDQAPRTYWEVPEVKSVPLQDQSATSKVEALPLAPQELLKPKMADFAPENVGPAQKKWAAKGDGIWLAIRDIQHQNDSPRLFKTLLHPDKKRSWAELFVVAVDLRQVEVKPVMGYQEPRTEKKAAEGYVRPAKIPEADWPELLGAFNGGFMAEHGHYGVYFDGISFIDPRPEACTFAFYRDGHFAVAPWETLEPDFAQMLWYRQAPGCMYNAGKMHPGINRHHARKWGATLDGNTVIRRSAVGLSADGEILYVGISNHTTAKTIAEGMHHAGADSIAQMDVNWSYPKFVTYEPDNEAILKPVALAKGFEFSDKLYLRERSMRDFFYLKRKAMTDAENSSVTSAEHQTTITD